MNLVLKKYWWLLVIGYLAFVLFGTLGIQGRSLFEWVNLLVPAGKIRDLLIYPLQHHHPVTYHTLLNIGDKLANLFLFFPFGIGIYLLFQQFRPETSLRAILITALLTGLVLSSCIEAVQAFVPKRIPSLADVIANTGGAVFGCYLVGFRKLYREFKAP